MAKAAGIIDTIRGELEAMADPVLRESGRRFFKEDVCLYGTKTSAVQKMARTHFKSVENEGKKQILSYCDDLWRSGYMEESFIACNWSYYIKDKYSPEDFGVFETWVEKYVSNWASCDTLCNHTVGTFIEKYPEYLSNLKEWARSENRWMRRASAVSLIIPARQGKFLKDILEIADILFLDPDDLVQKGYGWMLKAASESHQVAVFEYVMKNKSRMPRTALRYAIEKMPKDLKAKAMEK
jgi:3-methyladenine DNA glycosylase AlkD